MACKMRLAILAAEDLVGVEVGIVDEAHAVGLWPEGVGVLDGAETMRNCPLDLRADAEAVRWVCSWMLW